MLRSTASGAAFAFAAFLAAAEPAAAQVLGPHAAACRAGRPAFLVTIDGFKRRSGNLRVQLYRADSSFLERGRWLQRVDLPVTGSGPMRVCITPPGPGSYAVAVRHDVTGNGSDWGDGGGFSRNPRLSLTNLRPNVRNVAVDFGDNLVGLNVVLNYRSGMSIGPVR